MIARFTGSVSIRVGCVLAGMVAFGCKSPSQADSSAVEGSAAVMTVGDPPPIKDPQLYLLSEGKKIQLGESVDEALRVFEPPKSAFELGPHFSGMRRIITTNTKNSRNCVGSICSFYGHTWDSLWVKHIIHASSFKKLSQVHNNKPLSKVLCRYSWNSILV